jgi:hypothetical protein
MKCLEFRLKRRAAKSHRRRAVRAVHLSLFLIAFGLAATTALTNAQTARANTFGGRYLVVGQCCNGAGLYGTRASITTPVSASDLTFPVQQCFLARSDGEIPGDRLIQTGFVRCASGQSLDGTCSLTNNLVSFIEIAFSGGFTCYPKGGVGYNTTHLYTVRRQFGDTWYAFIDSVQDGHTLTMGGANQIEEGAEWTGGCDSFKGYADWAFSTAWQRWTSTDWFTVQSSSLGLDCGWATTGGPPNHFQFSH